MQLTKANAELLFGRECSPILDVLLKNDPAAFLRRVDACRQLGVTLANQYVAAAATLKANRKAKPRRYPNPRIVKFEEL